MSIVYETIWTFFKTLWCKNVQKCRRYHKIGGRVSKYWEHLSHWIDVWTYITPRFLGFSREIKAKTPKTEDMYQWKYTRWAILVWFGWDIGWKRPSMVCNMRFNIGIAWKIPSWNKSFQNIGECTGIKTSKASGWSEMYKIQIQFRWF